MLQKLMIPALLLYVLVAGSCKASKKLEAANGQISALTEKNNQLTANANSLKKQVDDLSTQNSSMTTQFASYKKECEGKAEEMKKVQAVLTEFDKNLQSLEERLDTALAKFEAKGIDVYTKDRLVYVDMKDDLLYKSGSSALSPTGKEALGDLSSVLNEFPKLKVIVVGNTDDVKFKNSNADNLSLSTDRANGVVRLLVGDYKVDPLRLTSAGKGKFNPIADNSTAEGRAKNRRTEIILNPDWERIWETVKEDRAGVNKQQ
jgi:chemotaxis protein MotB